MTDNHRVPSLSSAISRLATVSWASIRVRYRPSRRIALIHATAALLDVLVYASAVYFVVAVVFERSGFARFALILVGFIAFLWTIRSILEASTFVELRKRLIESSSVPIAATIVVCLAPPTFTFLISLGLAVAIEIAVLGSVERLAAVAWLVPTVAIHLVWNVVLLLGLGLGLERRWIDGVVPASLSAAVVWLVSPVMYRFEDIPSPANALLTRLNPASHLLAAYHNALWRAEPMSLKVLPAVGVIGLVVLVWLVRRVAAARVPPRAAGETQRGPDWQGPHLIVALDGFVPPLQAGRIFGRWRGHVGGLTGEDLTTLIEAARGRHDHDEARIASIGGASRIGRLYRDSLSIYPPWALAQLAFACAMESGEDSLVLDGILDEVRPAFLAEAWALLEREAANGRRVTVVSYIAMSLPGAARGSFSAVGAGGQSRSGPIGPDIDAAYAALRVAARG